MLDEITPVILTFNEAPNIGRTLARLTWARRVVVVDSGSNDDTEAICKSYANVAFLTHAFVTHAEQWNWALNNTAVTTRWVLALDADYWISDELLAEVRNLDPAVDDVVGYRVPFKYRQSGRVLRGSLYPSVVALFARQSGVYCQDGHTQRLRVDGDVGQLDAFIVHDDRKSLQRWLTSQDRYAELECTHLLSTPMSKLSLQDKVRRTYFLAPFVVPVYCLIVKGLVLDGLPGWIYAFQRGIAETILAVKLIERRIGTSA